MIVPYPALKEDFSGLPSSEEWSFKNVGRAGTNYASHGYHRYPAKFIPQIVEKLILEHTKSGDLVLDPFGGCGTTLVEAKILGRRNVGFDINPVAKLITDTKTTPIEPDKLNRVFNKFLGKIAESRKIRFNLAHSERVKYWFHPTTLVELDQLYFAIHQINDYKIRRFFLCSFSQVLKIASRWLTKSIKPQLNPEKDAHPVLPIFQRHLSQMIKKNAEFYELLKTAGNLNVSTKMRLVDSTNRFPLSEEVVDLIVTSPPYVTSYEYADLHQLTLLWLGQDKLRYPRWAKYALQYSEFRQRFVGSRIKRIGLSKVKLPPSAREIIKRLPQNQKYAHSVERYFLDMQKSFKEMYRVLKESGKIAVIIGNTVLSGIKVKNAEVAADLLQEKGFSIEEIVKREISNKMITPWRDKKTGHFTGIKNKNKRKAYNYEYIIVAKR